ncbi:CLUMA_CG006029, isoform A [Clunio marinus]|uniref:CLUMA_CG006029, isoform A n=1 Tax=Clunio marinus TaxID=568069 RepID=A0A1J1HWV2_9DIPT|nr:CLUMA_CG006029, isoform A [Clunio marinus]
MECFNHWNQNIFYQCYIIYTNISIPSSTSGNSAKVNFDSPYRKLNTHCKFPIRFLLGHIINAASQNSRNPLKANHRNTSGEVVPPGYLQPINELTDHTLWSILSLKIQKNFLNVNIKF